ncbi:hypothetical protein [Serratia symbiotica]|uniref:hypothetical protein n=1 Tax=Serratia symbiotica TaxID=138074 RepID=UPI001CF04520|nr:hypothetical protein [Serratia symbiotica]
MAVSFFEENLASNQRIVFFIFILYTFSIATIVYVLYIYPIETTQQQPAAATSSGNIPAGNTTSYPLIA